MPLSVGARLGHYAVTAKLGEGGMGEVWEATDTQLNRTRTPERAEPVSRPSMFQRALFTEH